MRVTGDRFSCANDSRTVQVSWDDGTQLPSASLDPSGHFDTSVSVPANTDARRLTLRASCPDGPAAVWLRLHCHRPAHPRHPRLLATAAL